MTARPQKRTSLGGPSAVLAVDKIREIGDRIDGKVAQAIAGDNELPPVSMIITGVVRAGDPQD